MSAVKAQHTAAPKAANSKIGNVIGAVPIIVNGLGNWARPKGRILTAGDSLAC
jgi:hypothetical protein